MNMASSDSQIDKPQHCGRPKKAELPDETRARKARQYYGESFKAVSRMSVCISSWKFGLSLLHKVILRCVPAKFVKLSLAGVDGTTLPWSLSRKEKSSPWQIPLWYSAGVSSFLKQIIQWGQSSYKGSHFQLSSHLQSRVKSRRQMMVFVPLVVVWIG